MMRLTLLAAALALAAPPAYAEPVRHAVVPSDVVVTSSGNGGLSCRLHADEDTREGWVEAGPWHVTSAVSVTLTCWFQSSPTPAPPGGAVVAVTTPGSVGALASPFFYSGTLAGWYLCSAMPGYTACAAVRIVPGDGSAVDFPARGPGR